MINLKEYIERAENGDVGYQNKLGLIFGEGEIVEQDFSKSYEWFSKSASQNNPFGLCYLGLMLIDGYEGVNQDIIKGIKLLEKSANLNNDIAQLNLAQLYSVGECLEKDELKSFKLYLKSAINGNGKAQHNLAIFYFNGGIVEHNTIEGYAWFLCAVNNGISESYDFIKKLESEFSDAELKQAKILAKEYSSKYSK